jgi:hypothetical protein
MSKALAEEIDLHRRLLARDVTAPALLLERYVGALTAALQRKFAGQIDPDFVVDEVVDSLLALPEHLEPCDPEKLSLQSYLRMDADGNIRHRIQSLGRRRRLRPIEDVEQFGAMRNQGIDDPGTVVVDREGIDLPADLDREQALTEIRAAFDDPRDLKAIELIYEGERRTDVFAALYGLAEHDELGRRRDVKRIKDRLIKKRERLVQRMVQQSEGGRGGRPATGDGDVLD